MGTYLLPGNLEGELSEIEPAIGLDIELTIITAAMITSTDPISKYCWFF
ncbi:hypothetical protein [Methanosarcina horonobensis]|nr:hypothetical protein [Methanosarcina horonobensis]